MTDFDFSVFIGRFQPLHAGHEHVVREALSRIKQLIVLIGSANVARDPLNPFTYEERLAMFRRAFAYDIANKRLIIEPLDDHPYSDTAWCGDPRIPPPMRSSHHDQYHSCNRQLQAQPLPPISTRSAGDQRLC